MLSKFMTIKKFCIYSILLTCCFNISANSKENFFNEGVKLFKNKKYADSKFKFQQDIVFNPKSEIAYLYLAKIFKEEKNDNQEEQYLNTVILLNPKNEEAIYLMTLLQIKKSDYDESNELIKKFKKVCREICSKESELKLKLKSIQTN